MGSRLVRVINLLYGIYRGIRTVEQLPVPVTVHEPMKDLGSKPHFEFVGNSSAVTPAIRGMRVRVGPFERIGYSLGDAMSFAPSNVTDENETDSSLSQCQPVVILNPRGTLQVASYASSIGDLHWLL